MSKYTKLDAAIVRAIENHSTTFSGLLGACREHLTIKTKGRTYEDDRLLDRRLQAMRKAGRTKFAKGHWSIV